MKNIIQTCITVVTYTYLVISFIGFVSNILLLIIFSRKKFQNTVFSSYFRFITIFNLISMIMPVNKFFEFNLNIYFKDINDSLCKFRMLTFYVLFPIYCWGLVIISIDRYLSIAFPNKFIFKKKLSFQIQVCCFILIFNIIYYVPLLFSHVKETENFNKETNKTITIKTCVNNIYQKDLFNALNTTVIPFLIMFLFTLLTLVKLFQSRQKQVNNDSQKRTRVKDIRFAITSIALNFIFLFLNLPYGIFSIVNLYINGSINRDVDKLIQSIFFIFYYSNLISVFFINITVNKIFRDELFLFYSKKIKYNLCCCRKK